jgi:hypothetical protein
LDLPRLLLPSTTGWLGPLINYLFMLCGTVSDSRIGGRRRAG